MFIDAYRDTFATLGVRLVSEDACSTADIDDPERRLGIKLPGSLKEYYLVAGREERINRFHNRLLPPEGSVLRPLKSGKLPEYKSLAA